jgi:integrase
LADAAREPFRFVFENKDGRPINKTSRKRMWRSIVRAMNIAAGCRVFRNEVLPPFAIAEDFVPYCLRHTYCTDLQAAGVPINVAKELMGHTSIAMTANIYTHGSRESFENARDLINKCAGERAGSD